MDTSFLKKFQVWAVVIPAVLGIWALTSTVKMASQRQATQKQQDLTLQTERSARGILRILAKSGNTNLPGGGSRNFDGVASARTCATQALIPESRLNRLESSKPDRQKDGTILHSETYKLTGVSVLQTAQFIDVAERNYDLLNCTTLDLTPVRSKTRDSWDAAIRLQYLEKPD